MPKHGKNNPPSGNKQAEGQEKSSNRHVYVEPGVQIDLVQDLKKAYQSSQTDTTTHNNKQLFWTKVSAGLLFIYAGLTLWQSCSANRAANAAKRSVDNAVIQFHADQRPILWLTNNLGVPTPCGAKGQVCWSWQYTNYGKTPAQEIKLYQFMQIGDGQWEPSFSDKAGPEIAAPIPTGKIDTDSVLSNPNIKIDFENVHHIDHHIRIKVRIEYRDVYGTPYESTFCYGTLVYGWPDKMNYCPPPDNYIH